MPFATSDAGYPGDMKHQVRPQYRTGSCFQCFLFSVPHAHRGAPLFAEKLAVGF